DRETDDGLSPVDAPAQRIAVQPHPAQTADQRPVQCPRFRGSRVRGPRFPGPHFGMLTFSAPSLRAPRERQLVTASSRAPPALVGRTLSGRAHHTEPDSAMTRFGVIAGRFKWADRGSGAG